MCFVVTVLTLALRMTRRPQTPMLAAAPNEAAQGRTRRLASFDAESAPYEIVELANHHVDDGEENTAIYDHLELTEFKTMPRAGASPGSRGDTYDHLGFAEAAPGLPPNDVTVSSEPYWQMRPRWVGDSPITADGEPCRHVLASDQAAEQSVSVQSFGDDSSRTYARLASGTAAPSHPVDPPPYSHLHLFRDACRCPSGDETTPARRQPVVLHLLPSTNGGALYPFSSVV